MILKPFEAMVSVAIAMQSIHSCSTPLPTHAPTTAGALLARDCDDDEHARAGGTGTPPTPQAFPWPAVAPRRHGRWGLDACGVRFERRARQGIGVAHSSPWAVACGLWGWPAGRSGLDASRCSRWMLVPDCLQHQDDDGSMQHRTMTMTCHFFVSQAKQPELKNGLTGPAWRSNTH